MNVIKQALSHFSQDIAHIPDKEALGTFFADLSDADLVEFANCLIDCIEEIRPQDCILFETFVLKETTKRALSADE